MSEIQQGKKKQRDWLNAWTILVLPGVFWSGLAALYYINPLAFESFDSGGRYSSSLSFFIPLCLLLAIVYYYFGKSSDGRWNVLRRIQMILVIAFSVSYLFLLIMTILYNFRPCKMKDFENPYEWRCYVYTVA
jgi:hypothetical protein